MKLDPNTEIDRLMQRTARRGAASSLSFSARHQDGGSDGTEQQHLDADELSAYAENALPAAARARYMSHLADCDVCRKQVTELVLSLGVASELEREAATTTQPSTALSSSSAAPARTWRMRLAALFAPAALRYAATLVVLVGVVAIAFMVFRGGRQMKFSDVDSGTTNAPPSPNSQTANQNQQVDSDGPNTAPIPSQTPAGTLGAPTSKDAQTQPEGQAAAAPPAVAPADAPKETAPTTTASGARSNDFSIDGQDAGANEVAGDENASVVGGNKQAAPAGPQRTEKEKDQREAKAIDATSGIADLSSAQSSSRRDADKKMEEELAKNRPQSPPKESQPRARRGAARSAKTATANERMASGEASDDNLMRDEDRASTQQEKRNVSGRQFVRRGGAWVDTAYRSQATTNVRRGSEQYRALVADEPGLRTITHELGGEVIIVWKGRAYRIR